MDIRFRRILRLAALLAPAALMTACASTTPRWDLSFGNTVRSTFAAQVIDPNGSRNGDPVAGVDGRSARAAHERYERANAAPQGAPISLMNGGGAQ